VAKTSYPLPGSRFPPASQPAGGSRAGWGYWTNLETRLDKGRRPGFGITETVGTRLFVTKPRTTGRQRARTFRQRAIAYGAGFVTAHVPTPLAFRKDLYLGLAATVGIWTFGSRLEPGQGLAPAFRMGSLHGGLLRGGIEVIRRSTEVSTAVSSAVDAYRRSSHGWVLELGDIIRDAPAYQAPAGGFSWQRFFETGSGSGWIPGWGL
jgi:hypothetical protein